MRALFINLMAGLLLIPAMLGWCCHPALDCAQCIQSASAQLVQVQSPIHLGCKACRRGQESHERHAPCCECKGFCTYIPSAKVCLDSPDNFAGGVYFAIVPESITCDVLTHVSQVNHADNTTPAAPSLRLHLLNQIWLI
jgi:hypothetical protein